MNTHQEHLHPRGTIIVRAYKAGTRELVREIVQHNLIMKGANLGRDLLVQWLIGLTTYPGGIAWGAIGTGSTAPTYTDTKLQTESARSAPTYTQDTTYDTAVVKFFFADANLANATYREFGTFVGGSASADSGQLFNRALFSVPYVKTAGLDTTIEVDITLT